MIAKILVGFAFAVMILYVALILVHVVSIYWR